MILLILLVILQLVCLFISHLSGYRKRTA